MMISGLITAFIMGIVANNYGRKPAILISSVLYSISLFILAFIPGDTNYWILCAVYGLLGFLFPALTF